MMLARALLLATPLVLAGCASSNTGTVDARSEPPNVLSAAEEAAGWRLLFDGETSEGWRGFRKDEMPAGWEVRDGMLARTGAGGDIITEGQYESFELKLEWRLAEGGNSGVFFHVTEETGSVWESGPEMQVLDNRAHADGLDAKSSAGANYALHAPAADFTRPVGEFNQVRLLVVGQKVEHWLNGRRIVAYELGSDDWESRVAASKFATMPAYGRARRGHIALQDHGDPVWYRSIKIRELAPR